MPFTVEILSQAELEVIWKMRARAADFDKYLQLVNALDIGDGFRIQPESDEHAKVVRHNFSEAAKERVKPLRDKDNKIVGHKVKAQPMLRDGQPIPEPVIIRWKTVTKDVTTKNKQTGVETTATVIVALEALLIATTEVKPRGPRPETETVAVPNATAEQITAKKLTLSDGRVAKLHKDGTWHAQKIAVVTAQESANGVSSNGNAPAETPAEGEKVSA